MQIVVRRSDLANPSPVVLAHYDDGAVVDAKALGVTEDVVVLNVPSSALVHQERGPPTLASSWRTDNSGNLANAEAARRINLVFPDYAQRNASADLTDSIIKYGPDPATWPSDARDRKQLADQGWSYINSVRQQSNALGQTVQSDITSDTHWPTIIPRISYPTK